MANQSDGGTQAEGADSGIDQKILNQRDKERRKHGRDDTLDEDLERERLEPGQNGEGTGGVGAPPGTPSDGNSNT
jgi:hypothetical protein